MSDQKTMVEQDQLDDIIGEAARKKQVAEEMLSVAEIKEVAAELDIDAEYVDAAVHELERRKEQAAKREARADERARRLRKIALGVTGVIAAICVGMFGISYARLSSALSAAEQQRAQVENVVERQANTLAQYQGQGDSLEKNAALEGAENRVRIEIRRYDEAAGSYNETARGLFGGAVTSTVGMPEELPLSNEIDTW